VLFGASPNTFSLCRNEEGSVTNSSIAFLDNLFGFLSYDYAQRALVVGILVALCAALLGVTLILKRLSMIGDGLSHAGFGALSAAMAFNWAPLAVARPLVMAAAFLLLRLSDNSAIKGDAAIAVISSSSLAFGFMMASASQANINISSYLFGSLLAIDKSDVVLSVVLALLVLGMYMILYHSIFAVTFDEEFVGAAGMPAALYKGAVGLMTAVTIVLGMRIMGTLLISSLIIFPGLTAMRVWGSFRNVVRAASVISVVIFFAGMTVAFVFDLKPGATIVLVHTAVFVVFWLGQKLMRRLR
jgi:zinc transport system permease protein